MISTSSRPSIHAVVWLQVVASKSGGEPHHVRGFDNGLITCDCKAYEYRGKCSHTATGQAQEAREAAAFNEHGEFAAEVSIPAEDVFVWQATDFDAFEGSEMPNEPAPQPQPRRAAAQMRQDYRDLFNEDYEAA